MQTTGSVSKKPNIWGLVSPFLIVAVLIGLWSGYWVYAANKIEARIEETKAALIRSGYQVGYAPVKVEGYPFRMFLRFADFKIIAPNGKGFAAPSIEAEANAYALTKWVFVAPSGATLYRGHYRAMDLGALTISSPSLRASITDIDKPIPHIALSASTVVLSGQTDKKPFFFEKAERFEAYIRPSKASQSLDFLWRLSGATGIPTSAIAKLSPEEPVNVHVEGSFDHLDAFKGIDAAQAIDTWRKAGGQVRDTKGSFKAAGISLFATSAQLGLNDSMQPVGQIDFEVSGKIKPYFLLKTLGFITEEKADILAPFIQMNFDTKGPLPFTLTFKDGYGYIGPVKVSSAPILIETDPTE